MPCEPLTPFPTTPTNFYFASYFIEFDFIADTLGCNPHACISQRLRGFVNDFGVTFTCDHIRGLGLTVIYNSDFVTNVTLTLSSSFGDVNTTPTLIGIPFGEFIGIKTDADTDNIVCPFFPAIVDRIGDVLACADVDNDFSEGFTSASYSLFAIIRNDCAPNNDGLYWFFALNDSVRCLTYYTRYYRSLNDGRLASVAGTWIFMNPRGSCRPLPHFNHFVPLFWVMNCARQFTRGVHSNTKEDYEVLSALTEGDRLWEAQHDIDTLIKMRIIKAI